MAQNSMRIAGVIAEFNPFHDGHAYLLKKAREVTGADFVVVAMSGNFAQRGTPAVMEKSLRVRAALSHGADAVFELPVRTATGSADFFAEGAVHLLSALGVTDLCFGCETDDLSALERVADVLAEEPEPFREALKRGLKDGLSYAAAVQRAVEECHILTSETIFENSTPQDRISEMIRANQCGIANQCGGPDSLIPGNTGSAAEIPARSGKASANLTPLLSLPNNLLAISYLKALRKCGSSIRPHAILRRGAAYHSKDSVPVSEEFPSAAALRKQMGDVLCSGARLSGRTIFPTDTTPAPIPENIPGKEILPAVSASDRTAAHPSVNKEETATGSIGPAAFAALQPYFSDSLFSLYQPEFARTFPVFPDDFSLLLGKSLLDLKPEEAYFDCAPDLYRRIYKHRREFISFDSFCQSIHTKQFSLASAQRGVLHCMLGLKAGSKDDLYAAYLPLLGFRKDAGTLLSEISRHSPLPLLSKTCEGRNLSDPRAVRQWEEIMYADALYRLVRCCRFGREFPMPEQAQIVVTE